MRIIYKITLFSLLSCVACLSFAAEAVDAPVAATGTTSGFPQEIADAIAQQELVNQLAAYAAENNDVLAYILAASIANKLAGGPAQPKGTKMSKAFSAQPSASTQLLNKAKGIAGSDESMLKLIANVESKSSKDWPATCYATSNVGGWFYWTGPNRTSARISVMYLCQSNTPYGAYCSDAGCD